MKRGIFLLFLGLLAGAGGMSWWGSQGRVEAGQWQRESAALRAEILELQEKLGAREKAWVQFNEDWKKAQEDGKAPPAATPDPPSGGQKSSVPPPDPNAFPARFNRAMQAQSLHEWTLEECGEAKEGTILAAALFRHGPAGAVSGLLRCESMSLVLPPTPDVVWLLCHEGYSIVDGRKMPLPEEGFRIELAPVKIDELRAALPELFLSGKPASVAPAVAAGEKPPISGVEALRERLDALWAKDPSGYRLVKLGSATDRELRDLEIEERSGDAVEARFKASVAKPRFDEAGKTVELILERGSIERRNKISPLPAAGFRLHFPGVSPANWKTAGGPIPR